MVSSKKKITPLTTIMIHVPKGVFLEGIVSRIGIIDVYLSLFRFWNNGMMEEWKYESKSNFH